MSLDRDPRLQFFNPFRVIPCLLIDSSGMVKTERFRKPRYLGDILNALRIFNEKEVDEIVVLDIEAARTRRPPNIDLIAELSAECFMPLAYGGGVATAEQAKQIVRLGVEKVILNTAAFERPDLLREIAATIGSQSVVVGIDVKRGLLGGRKVVVRSASKTTSLDLATAVSMAEDGGAGEILLQSVDRDGTMSGYDLDVIRSVTALTRLPVVAAGGARDSTDLAAAVGEAGASAVAAGGMFVYQGPHRAVLISYPTPAEIHRATQKIGG